ncbi:MAG TPA: response regulator transcription factor [Nocardioides sp.]|nr:response regulator transcription factor [Nocardioides sp.]
MSGEIEIVVVEDHPTFRLGLRGRLELEPDLVVVGEASSAEEALPLISELMPDVALVDLNLPGMDGVALTRELTQTAPAVKVLVLTMLDDEHVFTALRAGARGYLLKDTEPTAIVAAVRTVAGGSTVFSAGIADRLLAHQAGDAPRPFLDLSLRETEILRLVAGGLTNAEIGRRLDLSPKTVRNYVSHVIGKLQAADRADLVERARNAGLTSS